MSSEQVRLINDVITRIRAMSERTAQMSSCAAAVIGINTTDLACINMLLNGPLTPGEMARRVGLTTAAMTGVLDRLEQGGFVTRTRDPRDRRRVLVEFRAHEAGPGLARVFRPVLSGWRTQLADYDARDLRLIVDFLDRIENVLATEIDRMQGP
jgi:DNA-binding MarR family transcriptional regulator